MKRKVLSILSILSLVAAFSAGSSFAKTNNIQERNLEGYNIVQKNQEVTDLNTLYELAKKNSKAKSKHTLVDPKTGEQLAVEEFVTSQTLQIAKNDKGEQIETVAVTKLVVLADTSKTDSDWDSTLGVKATSTIYLDKVKDPRGALHYKLISVNGNWKKDDSTYSLTNRVVEYGAAGWSYFGNTFGQNETKKPTSDTFNYTAPSSWYPSTTDNGAVGVTMTVKLSKGGSSWNFEFVNNM
ncbi:hypothetical protein T458_11165 [Brevibacillus panacihumi W25]|uniref:Uncharacterized protein n=1 Tax=Brevibacillus panacihumi W25 TaxID=1408254 RepID=V6M9S4_9BACL|nr:hypothetical protein [Brevibacillus panacihumi]EST55017.1 hypothetical protein T458_11165 [Brevibacillus panacihumi W25]